MLLILVPDSLKLFPDVGKDVTEQSVNMYFQPEKYLTFSVREALPKAQ